MVSTVITCIDCVYLVEEKRERSETNGTVSPDLLVNSIAKGFYLLFIFRFLII